VRGATRSRATLTNLLILINVLAFAWEFATGAFSGTPQHQAFVLEADGALNGYDVLQNGQWWRIVTGAFLHGGILHIGVNMFSLYVLGRPTEQIFGRLRLAIIYALALVASGLAVVYFAQPDVSTIGASGAIFGLFGALFAIGAREGKAGVPLIKQMVPWLVINLAFDFYAPGISWQAHIGGLIAGFVVGLVLFPQRAREPEVAYAFQPRADQHRVQTIEQPPVEPPA
jgi:membrane associated rhomboid family serine protease